MIKFKKDSKITILNNEKTVQSLLETLIYYPANQVIKFFQEINLSFPRNIRIAALKLVLRDPVNQTRIERATLADEMNYRLSWFNQYTESQLVNLFSFYNDPIIEKAYLEELWINFINYITDKKIDEKDFDRLIKDSVSHLKKAGIKLPDLKQYNDELDVLFFDENNKIDGLTPDVIRPVLFKSSTLNEIRDLGKKYGVNVPRRLKKSELIDIIVGELKSRGEYTEDKETHLNKLSVLLIQRFAIDNKIKVSTELKKEEIIEYVLANANETRETYFVPSSSVYELEAHDVGEAMPEVVVEPVVEEAPVVEEVVEEIVEETKEEEIVEEVIEEIQEEVVEETVEELVLEEAPIVKEQVLYTNELEDEVRTLRKEVEELKHKETKLEVETKILNTTQFKGKNAKKHRQLIEKEQNRQRETAIDQVNDRNVHQIYITGFGANDDKLKKNKKGGFWKGVLKFFLTLIILLLIVVLVYGMIRPVGGYTEGIMKQIDDVLNVGGILNKFTEWFKGLF